MKTNKPFVKTNSAFVIFNLIAAAVIGLTIIIAVFVWLGKYTNHGEQTAVPSVCGMYSEEAQIILQAVGLKMEIIDSTYSKKVPLGTIVEQNPPTGSNVKQGRTIYVITNARMQRQIPMPELHDISYRQAEATLIALGLRVDSLHYEPSEYRNLVLDVRYGGQSVEAGTRLNEGTGVMLVVGEGKGTEDVQVPNLQGQSLAGARELLLGARLIVGAVDYDEPIDDLSNNQEQSIVTYYVYDQRPKAGQLAKEGSHINLRLSTDPNKQAEIVEQDEEDFF